MWEGLARNDEFAHINQYLYEMGGTDSRNAMLHQYVRTYLLDDVLVKVDRASMCHALEVRSPFLDCEVVDFVYSLPYDFKCRGFTTKYILKKMMSSRLPKDIVSRPKKGFGMPLSSWLRNELKGVCDELLSKKTIRGIGIFNFEYINKLKEEHMSGKIDHRKRLWTLLTFVMWHKRYG